MDSNANFFGKQARGPGQALALAGHYVITLNSSLLSGFSLIPIATPEVDTTGMGVPPTGSASARFCVINTVAAGNKFEAFMYNGDYTLVDNDFAVIVTGR